MDLWKKDVIHVMIMLLDSLKKWGITIIFRVVLDLGRRLMRIVIVGVKSLLCSRLFCRTTRARPKLKGGSEGKGRPVPNLQWVVDHPWRQIVCNARLSVIDGISVSRGGAAAEVVVFKLRPDILKSVISNSQWHLEFPDFETISQLLEVTSSTSR